MRPDGSLYVGLWTSNFSWTTNNDVKNSLKQELGVGNSKDPSNWNSVSNIKNLLYFIL